MYEQIWHTTSHNTLNVDQPERGSTLGCSRRFTVIAWICFTQTSYTHVYTHTNTHTLTHTHTHTLTHTHIHVYTHTHSHKQTYCSTVSYCRTINFGSRLFLAVYLTTVKMNMYCIWLLFLVFEHQKKILSITSQGDLTCCGLVASDSNTLTTCSDLSLSPVIRRV